jgi:hypothetical protein
MADNWKKRDPVRAAFARMGNPYVFDECQYPDEDAIKQFFERRAYLRVLEDPYASLVVDDRAPVMASASAKLEAPREQSGQRGCSKAEFRARCRTIFGGYMPALEKGRLREHHRDFIVRNESRDPQVRSRLLSLLARYDLSTHPGLTGQFNRERDVFTEQKLRSIERDAVEAE